MMTATEGVTKKLKSSSAVLSSVDDTAVYHVTSVDRARDKKLQGNYKTCGRSQVRQKGLVANLQYIGHLANMIWCVS